MTRLCLIDLSGIFRSAWHASEHDEISSAVNRTVSIVTTSSAGYDYVAICADRPPYKRAAISAEYKAQREMQPEAMYESLRAVECELDAAGYHIVGSPGYEADDILAVFAAWGRGKGFETTIYSADKDLLQLVGSGVSVISTATKVKYESDADVVAKLGVTPGLVPDLLALVGDASDNIAGIKGVGFKTAAGWLSTYGSLEGIMIHLEELPERFREAMKAGHDTILTGLKLTTLMTDAPINPEEILTPKEHKDLPRAEPVIIDDEPETAEPVRQTAMTVAQPAAIDTQWDKALEPRTPAQAWGIAQALYKSRIFGSFPNPEAILAIVMTGRTLGLDAVTSLRDFDLIEGKPSPKAQLLIGLVKRHPSCEFFRLVSSDEKAATYETVRKGEPEATRLTYTYEQALLAGHVKGKDGNPKKNWRDPATMLRWRCAVALARIVYPDVLSGLYAAEELE